MGGSSGPACLFIHGFLSSRAQWLLNLDSLATICRPVVVELWGHGRSPAPNDPARYTTQSFCAEFELLRERLGIEEWFVIGQSLGAGLALHYAHTYPARVLGVVLTNSLVAFSTPEAVAHRTSQASLTRLRLGGVDALEVLESMPMHVKRARRIPETLKTKMLADADLLNPQAVAMLIQHCLPSLSALEFLGQLPMPVMLINGRFESAFQPLRDLVLNLVPTVELVDLDGGHAINAECADATNAAILSFFERLKKKNEPTTEVVDYRGPKKLRPIL
jgi:pimeloyl-ACP methyl ester carboxylesterase